MAKPDRIIGRQRRAFKLRRPACRVQQCVPYTLLARGGYRQANNEAGPGRTKSGTASARRHA